MKASRKIAASLAGAFLLVVLGVVVSFWAFRQITDAAEARKHAFIVINRAGELLSEVRDAETGQRGYSLTGDETFLGPYVVARAGVRRHLEELRELTVIGAAQEHLAALAPLLEAKLAEIARVIELRRGNDLEAMLAAVRDGTGKRLMDSIRAGMSAVIQIEEDALARHEARFQSNLRRLFLILAVASLFTLLLAGSFAFLILRETRQRLRNQVHRETQRLFEVQKEANQRLQQANVTLQVSEEKLAVTLNSIGDAVIATDAEGRVTRLNPVGEQLTGWTQAQATGRPVDEIFHIINQETRQPATVPVQETLAHGTRHGLANHTLLIARDGSECAIADSCAPICGQDGRVVGAVLVFRDVTKEYAAQQAQRDNAALIQTILNTVVDGIITLRASGGVVETVNPAAERMFGYVAAELIGKNFSLLIPELDRDQRDGSLEYYLASDEARAVGLGREVAGRRKDGSTFPMEMAVSEMWLGSQRYFTGILRDSTARKKAEEALLRAGALQRAIFNSANFSCIATDAKGVIQIFNVGAERMLGYTTADVVNKITPADISDPVEVIGRARALSVELGTPITPGFEALVFKASRGIEDIYELTNVRKDGSRFPALVSVTALRDAQEGIIGYLLIGTDNTARKQAEELQRVSSAYARSLLEAALDPLATISSEGKITDVNMALVQATGFRREELIATDFSDYFTEPDKAREGYQQVFSQGFVRDYPLAMRHTSGRVTDVLYNASVYRNDQGSVLGVFAAARDVTERKRFELALQLSNVELEAAKSVAEKANLAKSEFLSSMSHELRSPLNAILGFAQLMESANPAPTTAQAAHITQILQAGWHLLKLINEILDLAVIESGQVVLSKESVSLAEILSECQSMMEPEALKRGIRMTFPRFSNPVFVRADMTRLKQIVINLLSNAIKYNKEKGTVVVDCTVSDPERIRISVRDTGAGLSPEKLGQLFQPFNRLGQEAGGVAGTGIGLVVTKRLAELMDGVLGVESTPGEGSVFWCELTSAAAPQLKLQTSDMDIADRPALSAGAPMRTLLYVEDNPANMELVEQLIARCANLRMLTAADGILGIDLARIALPTVILMDINLPGIGGIQALKILREDPTTAHIPVVALSANAMPRDIAKGLQAGFFRYLTKPIKIKELMGTLDEALEFAEKRLVLGVPPGAN